MSAFNGGSQGFSEQELREAQRLSLLAQEQSAIEFDLAEQERLALLQEEAIQASRRLAVQEQQEARQIEEAILQSQRLERQEQEQLERILDLSRQQEASPTFLEEFQPPLRRASLAASPSFFEPTYGGPVPTQPLAGPTASAPRIVLGESVAPPRSIAPPSIEPAPAGAPLSYRQYLQNLSREPVPSLRQTQPVGSITPLPLSSRTSQRVPPPLVPSSSLSPRSLSPPSLPPRSVSPPSLPPRSLSPPSLPPRSLSPTTSTSVSPPPPVTQPTIAPSGRSTAPGVPFVDYLRTLQQTPIRSTASQSPVPEQPLVGPTQATSIFAGAQSPSRPSTLPPSITASALSQFQTSATPAVASLGVPYSAYLSALQPSAEQRGTKRSLSQCLAEAAGDTPSVQKRPRPTVPRLSLRAVQPRVYASPADAPGRYFTWYSLIDATAGAAVPYDVDLPNRFPTEEEALRDAAAVGQATPDFHRTRALSEWMALNTASVCSAAPPRAQVLDLLTAEGRPARGYVLVALAVPSTTPLGQRVSGFLPWAESKRIVPDRNALEYYLVNESMSGGSIRNAADRLALDARTPLNGRKAFPNVPESAIEIIRCPLGSAASVGMLLAYALPEGSLSMQEVDDLATEMAASAEATLFPVPVATASLG